MDGKTAAALVRCYYKCNDSATEAIRQYSYRENNLKHPICSEKVLRGIIKRFEGTGDANSVKRGGRPSSVFEDEATVASVVQAKELTESENEWNCSSVRTIARRSDVSKSSVHRILRRKLQCRPYKMKVMQELNDSDFQKRLDFVNDFTEHFIDDLDYVIWSDEAYFYLDGSVHSKNAYIWSSENPQAFVTKPLHSAKICVWSAFSAKIVIPPVVIETGTLDGDGYLDILQNHFVPYLKSHRLCSRSIYQHDGAPPHVKGNVLRFLKNTFGEERLISRFNLHAWPPRSPDLSPLDFWFWGNLKRLVYSSGLPRSTSELAERVREKSSEITKAHIEAANKNFLDRLLLVIAADGDHIEHLM